MSGLIKWHNEVGSDHHVLETHGLGSVSIGLDTNDPDGAFWKVRICGQVEDTPPLFRIPGDTPVEVVKQIAISRYIVKLSCTISTLAICQEPATAEYFPR